MVYEEFMEAHPYISEVLQRDEVKSLRNELNMDHAFMRQLTIRTDDTSTFFLWNGKKVGETVDKAIVLYNTEVYYEGEWYNGKRSGKGTMVDPKGEWYSGQWLSDQPHGQGSYYCR